MQLYLLFRLSFDFRFGRHFLSNAEFLYNRFCSTYFHRKVNYFLYMLMKITDGRMEGRKVVPKLKGRQELHRGLLLRLWPSEKIYFDSFPVSVGYFGLSAAKTCLLWLQRWTSEGAGWRSEKLRCPCFHDKTTEHPKPRLSQQFTHST